MTIRVFKKRRLYNFLTELEGSSSHFITLYIRPSSFPDYIHSLSVNSKPGRYLDEVREAVNTKAVISKAEEYKTGAAIFWEENESKYIILPPFPITENKFLIDRLDTSLLYKILERKYIVGVVLVTWGSYAIGIFDGNNLVESKIGTGYIQKRHKKGGRSQKRFARRTEEQKKDFLRRVSNRIEEKFRNYTLDYIFFGGNKLIRKPLIKESKYLESRIEKISGRTLNIRYADKEALYCSLEEITQSLVFIC